MEIEEMAVRDAYRIRPRIHSDERGAFFESFRDEEFTRVTGQVFRPVQTNFSVNHRNVLRGMHGVSLPPGQAKYVTCVRGAVLDVVLDVRVGSPTFGGHDVSLLEPGKGTAVFLPDGMAHGFVSLTDDSCVSYVFDTPYIPGTPFEIDPFDPDLALPWPRTEEPVVVAPKDLQAPSLSRAAELGILPRYEDCLAHYARQRSSFLSHSPRNAIPGRPSAFAGDKE
ncbi:NDP-hexose 3,5-(Or5-) epimerase [Streptomyces sp. B4I13]|uniref:dTDP-4-dehydrorhamnose 3,5-epimerase family protein n=1 Tax=Streptomyces sp. B4I13 TaxID=3042271 RepID=UPI00278ACBC4|nr:dTDP-4-dehydrorhamnose 3,5-epimerase family protein [Streptomyces sp. B4I13]MDQ0960073.1 NDP-hexose 3,5-(Or5-) epimerase [Streptomyces sp. B4I13]